VADAWELLKGLGAGDGGEYATRFFHVGARIGGAVEKQYRATHSGCISHWIVNEAIETGLAAAPKNEQFGAGESGHAHEFETVPHSVQQIIEYGFHDDRVRLYVAVVDCSEDCRGAHGFAVEDCFWMRQALARIA
jgi:hypothetical protein